MIEDMRTGKAAREMALRAFGGEVDRWVRTAIAKVVLAVADDLDGVIRNFRNGLGALGAYDAVDWSGFADDWGARARGMNGYGDVPAVVGDMAGAARWLSDSLKAVRARGLDVAGWPEPENWTAHFGGAGLYGPRLPTLIADLAEAVDGMTDAVLALRETRHGAQRSKAPANRPRRTYAAPSTP